MKGRNGQEPAELEQYLQTLAGKGQKNGDHLTENEPVEGWKIVEGDSLASYVTRLRKHPI